MIRTGALVCPQVLWARDDADQLWTRMRLVVLQSGKEEQAVIFPTGYDECLQYGLAPLVPPLCGTTPLAVIHKHAASEMRSELAEFFTRLLGWGQRPESIDEAIEALAEQHTQTTLRHVYGGRLPVYEVHFDVKV